MVSGVGGTTQPELRGEARLPGMQTPKGGEESMARRTADQGVLAVEVADVDTEEVGVSGDRSWGDANAPFVDALEEMGRG